MRHAALAFSIVFIGLASPVLAFDTPRALLEAIYQPYQGQAERGDIRRFLSTRLDEIRQTQTESVVASTDHADDLSNFDPFVQGDAFFPFELVISEPAMLGDRAIATVSFRNFGDPSLMSIAMVREADGWKVDDIAAMGEGENWLYSWLLTVDPFGN